MRNRNTMTQRSIRMQKKKQLTNTNIPTKARARKRLPAKPPRPYPDTIDSKQTKNNGDGRWWRRSAATRAALRWLSRPPSSRLFLVLHPPPIHPTCWTCYAFLVGGFVFGRTRMYRGVNAKPAKGRFDDGCSLLSFVCSFGGRGRVVIRIDYGCFVRGSLNTSGYRTHKMFTRWVIIFLCKFWRKKIVFCLTKWILC